MLKNSVFIPFVIIALSLGGLCNPVHGQVVVSDSTRLDLKPPATAEPERITLLGVRVIGHQSTNEPFILATVSLAVGEEITIPGATLSNAIRRLYRTGLYSDVQILEDSRTDDGIYLVIRVKEQPRLDSYEITGVKKSERRDLREKIPLLSGFGITESSKSQAISTIKRFYVDKGFRNTQVRTQVIPTDTVLNRARMVFDIEPGQRLQVESIRIDGNEEYSDRTLRKKMKEVKQNAWWRLGRQLFKKDKYETAKDNLLTFYRSKGHRDIRIVEDSVYVTKFGKKDGIQVSLNIDEGPKYYVRNVNWDGNTVYTDEQLNASLDFRRGDLFNETKYEQNLTSNKEGTDIGGMYQNIGYLFFWMEKDIEVVGQDSLDLNFFIIENDIATIEKVDFRGNTRTHDNVIRRELRTYPGQIYSREDVIRSIRQLQTLTYFVPENMEPSLDADPEENKVNITYNLEESSGTDNFELSGGFGGRGIGMILSARVNFNNFSIQNMFNKESYDILPTGDGQRLSLGVQVTGRGYQNYDISFTEPWLNGRPVSLGFGTSYSLYSSSTFRYEMFSSSVSLGRRLTWPDDFFQHTNAIILQKYNVDDDAGEVMGNEGNDFLLSLRSVLERNSLDNPISPMTGSKFTLQGELAPPLFNFSQYYKIKTKFQFHIPVVNKLVFTYAMEWGHLGWIGDKNRSHFQRFFMGGTPMQQRQSFTTDNIDLRGFPGGIGGSITPYQNGQAIGGRIYNKYSTELRYPLVSNAQLQLIPYFFAEAGNTYRDFRNYDPFDVKRAAGIGTRIFLPILGLVDLSYGYRFDGIPNTAIGPRKWEFLFNIGAPF